MALKRFSTKRKGKVFGCYADFSAVAMGKFWSFTQKQVICAISDGNLGKRCTISGCSIIFAQDSIKIFFWKI
jgi:hypothetical protein